MFQEAYDRATEANLGAARDKAQERIAVLAPQVPVAKLHRAKPAAPGEKVVVDDVVVAPGVDELALDPGTHALVQTAPGRLSAQTSIAIAVSERRTVELAELQLPATRIVEKDVGSRRTLGRIAAFGGAGLAVVGVGLLGYAKRDYDKQFDDPDGDGPQRAHCGAFPDIGGKASCDAHGQQRTDRDRSLGTIASVVAIGGAVAATAGIPVWLTSPRRAATREHAVAVSPTSNGVVVFGRF